MVSVSMSCVRDKVPEVFGAAVCYCSLVACCRFVVACCRCAGCWAVVGPALEGGDTMHHMFPPPRQQPGSPEV